MPRIKLKLPLILPKKWGISAGAGQWNISGEPCTGAAVDSTTFDNKAYNPLIKCDCSANNGSTCHITQLYSLACSLTHSPLSSYTVVLSAGYAVGIYV
ncbi:hypothetical protein CRG98_042883 [Punica granatum]|uniref:Uncharacterized protein n=1 Tax=Punica granatum TaxID=22663 RepID=A0A2I0HYF4_PUNGR|nr:hypothetical protein CRG98_042883 [Punica granatum]